MSTGEWMLADMEEVVHCSLTVTTEAILATGAPQAEN